MGLKGNRGLQDRRALARRVAFLESRRLQLAAARPVIAARNAAEAWDAARDWPGAGGAAARRLVGDVFGADPRRGRR
jgi:hypothetical protein